MFFSCYAVQVRCKMFCALLPPPENGLAANHQSEA
jgi:hypothetical protein